MSVKKTECTVILSPPKTVCLPVCLICLSVAELICTLHNPHCADHDEPGVGLASKKERRYSLARFKVKPLRVRGGRSI